jgi:hypothetical protein
VVLGGESQVLDEGQEHRLVTGAIRRALELRDGGCIFPGCTVPADLCQAHHILPWWDEGPTSLENLALLCRHHHALVEPDRYHSRDQWRIVVDPVTRIPRMLPPERLKNHLSQSAVDPVAGGTGSATVGEDSVRIGAPSSGENSAQTANPDSGEDSAGTDSPSFGEGSAQAALVA